MSLQIFISAFTFNHKNALSKPILMDSKTSYPLPMTTFPAVFAPSEQTSAYFLPSVYSCLHPSPSTLIFTLPCIFLLISQQRLK